MGWREAGRLLQRGLGWGHSSEREHSSGTGETLGSIPGTAREEREKAPCPPPNRPPLASLFRSLNGVCPGSSLQTGRHLGASRLGVSRMMAKEGAHTLLRLTLEVFVWGKGWATPGAGCSGLLLGSLGTINGARD